MNNDIKELKEQLLYAITHSEEPEKAKRYYDAITNLQEENERLNNIIDKLKKWIKDNDLGKYRTENVVDTDELLDKLKELKGE